MQSVTANAVENHYSFHREVISISEFPEMGVIPTWMVYNEKSNEHGWFGGTPQFQDTSIWTMFHMLVCWKVMDLLKTLRAQPLPLPSYCRWIWCSGSDTDLRSQYPLPEKQLTYPTYPMSMAYLPGYFGRYCWAVGSKSLYHSIESWLAEIGIPRSWVITMPYVLGK